MAVDSDAMKWYNLGGQRAARTKYHFKVEFFSSKYNSSEGGRTSVQAPARLIFDTVRTIELPKYTIETEVVNAWNVRQLVPTKIVFEPLSISFNDTLDNRFQKFITTYMNVISGSFKKQDKSLRKEFDGFGLKLLDNDADCPIDKIVITRFYGADKDRNNLSNKSVVTLWRPKIVDVQHDTLDYSASEAVTWQLSVRYESITYEDEKESNLQTESRGEDRNRNAAVTARSTSGAPVDPNAANAGTGTEELRLPPGAEADQAPEAAATGLREPTEADRAEPVSPAPPDAASARAAEAAAATRQAQAQEAIAAAESKMVYNDTVAAGSEEAQTRTRIRQYMRGEEGIELTPAEQKYMNEWNSRINSNNQGAYSQTPATVREPAAVATQASEGEYSQALGAKTDATYELQTARSRLNYAEGRLKQLEERAAAGDTSPWASPEAIARQRQRVTDAQSNLEVRQQNHTEAIRRFGRADPTSPTYQGGTQ